MTQTPADAGGDKHKDPDMSPNAPEVCVVVAAFNAEKYLASALDSVLDQTVASWECIVVDDGSTDGTADVAARYEAMDPRFRLIQQTNGGSSRARNAGVAATSASPYVAFLDADDLWLPDTMSTLLARLRMSPDAAGVYGLAEYIDDAGHPLEPGLHPMRQRDRRRMGRLDLAHLPAHEPYTFSSLIISGTLWPASVVLHRRAVFERVGGFDPAMRQLQDWELYLRMSRHGPFVPVQQHVAWYRQHPENITKRSDRVAFFTMLVQWKAWTSSENTRAQRRYHRRVFRRLSIRWLIRAAFAGMRAWRGGNRAVTSDAVSAVGLFGRGVLVGHPDEPDTQKAHLFQQFISGVDREGQRDQRVAAGFGAGR